jgi:dTDP-4-amino-4,6-dideoxygalactose transaminase
VPLHRQECFGSRDAGEDTPFPHAERAAATSLALPIYGELTLEQQQHVVDVIADFYQ